MAETTDFVNQAFGIINYPVFWIILCALGIVITYFYFTKSHKIIQIDKIKLLNNFFREDNKFNNIARCFVKRHGKILFKVKSLSFCTIKKEKLLKLNVKPIWLWDMENPFEQTYTLFLNIKSCTLDNGNIILNDWFNFNAIGRILYNRGDNIAKKYIMAHNVMLDQIMMNNGIYAQLIRNTVVDLNESKVTQETHTIQSRSFDEQKAKAVTDVV